MQSTSPLIDRWSDWAHSADASNLSLRLAQWNIALGRASRGLDLRSADERVLKDLTTMLDTLADTFEFTASSGRRGQRASRFAGVEVPELIEAADIAPAPDLAGWLRQLRDDVVAAQAGDSSRAVAAERFIGDLTRVVAEAADRQPEAAEA